MDSGGQRHTTSRYETAASLGCPAMIRASALPALFMTTLLLCGCGGHGTQPLPQDQKLSNAFDTGLQAMRFLATDQAEQNFEAAYQQALLRDDASALHDAGYDLATAQLAHGKLQQSLDTLDRTRTGLLLRNDHAGKPLLDLVEASALYRAHRDTEAWQAASRALHTTDPALHERAAFVAGLIADRQKDLSALSSARQQIDPALSPVAAADAKELDTRLAMQRSAWKEAIPAASDLADQRRALLDYRGMRTALTLAEDAAIRAGDVTLANAFHTRAVQSAEAARPAQKQIKNQP
ncbi:Hypothetical protein GbCGDNIH3_1426 [Granulibacter bethesdensis]|uniref:Uncharacterized protein n=2 Tax=Granulibacter bethesdensis TaxID=364410 RepID=A0AAN0VG70_9PROT|nr:Hypothetical protein GbCGDNIH3_1426 [Granulibacter bethesdensis]